MRICDIIYCRTGDVSGAGELSFLSSIEFIVLSRARILKYRRYMGCGNGRRGTLQKPEGLSATSQYKVLDLLKLPNKQGDSSNKDAATNQGSFLEAVEETSKCLLCQSPNPQKVHTLDCTHPMCMNCAKEQLEAQMRTRGGNIIYFCTVCNAPKNLSNRLANISRDRVPYLRLCRRRPPARQDHPYGGFPRQDRPFRHEREE